MSFWAEDHASYPVEPFLLGEVQARGKLIHDGPGIRDSAGPVAIESGIRVLPHEYEDDHQGPHQDVAGRELTSEDGQKATFRPMPPLPVNQSGKNKASSQVRVAISNLTKKQWLRLKDDDARALEIVWVPLESNRHKLAKEEKRVLPSKTADDCLKLYFEKWNKKAPSCTLWPEFGGPTRKANPIRKSDTPPSLPTNQPPSRTVGMRERTPPPTSTRGRAFTPSTTTSPRVHDRLGPKTTSAYDRLGSKTSAFDRLGPKTPDVSKPVDKTRPRPNGPSAKVLACRAAAKAMTTKHQGLGDQPSDKITACKLAARKRRQDGNRDASTTRDPPKRRRGETLGKQSGGIYIEFGATSIQLKNPYHNMVGYGIRKSLEENDNE